MVNNEITPIVPENKEQESVTPDISDEEEDLTNLQAKVQTEKLKTEIVDDVPDRIDRSYEIIKGSTMYEQLVKIGKTEAEIKEFAEDIDGVVRKFLDQELEGFSNNIKNSMSVGIQFAMMETLVKQGAEGATEFFTAFSDTKSKSATKAFDGLYKAFGKLGSANEFFVLANKVQNLTRYLSDKKSIIAAAKNIPELENPSKFKTLLADKVRSTQAQIDKLDITKTLTLDNTTTVDVDEGLDALKLIVNNEKMKDVITEKSITSIEKSLKTADKLLDNRGKFKDKASELVDKIAGILDIDIFGFGTLGELTGMEFPTDAFGNKDQGGVINFVLGVLGFRGGLKGLHREYIKDKLEELDIDDAFIVAAYTAFQKDADATITNDSDTSTWKTCALVGTDATVETAMKAKIPADYAGLKKSIADNLSTATLNPDMVAKFAPGAITTENDKNVVDMTQITGSEDSFVDTYLKYIIPVLADPTDDFIKSEKVDKDSFVLAVIGGLIGDKYFIEGVNIGLLATTDYKTVTADNKTSTNTDTYYEDIDETDTELLRLATGPNESYSDNETFVRYLHSLEGKNSLPYSSMLNVMIAESSGRLYKTDGKTIIGSAVGARGLFAFMPDTAKSYITKIKKDETTYYAETDYEKIYTNPIIAAKAASLFLKDRMDAGDDTVNMLAHYNAGPGTISGAKVTADTFSSLPTETQNYVVKIGMAMLEDSQKDMVLTAAEKADTKSISKASLESFFTAVNVIPAPEKTVIPEIASDVKIEAKTIDDVVLFGDSHAGGIETYGKFKGKTFFYNGYDAKQLLTEIKKEKTTVKKYKSLVLVVGTNDISKGLTNTLKDNLAAIQKEIVPVQLVLSTILYSNLKTIIPDAKVDEVNTIIKTFAKDNSLPLIDLNSEVTLETAEYVASGPSIGHYTSAGYTKISENITDHITGDENTA